MSSVVCKGMLYALRKAEMFFHQHICHNLAKPAAATSQPQQQAGTPRREPA
jgi:hypothetical protein